MTKTLSIGNKTVRPHGTRIGMQVKARLERVLSIPDYYDIEACGGCAKITADGNVSLDAHEIRRIRESVDLNVFYVRDDGVYVGWRALL